MSLLKLKHTFFRILRNKYIISFLIFLIWVLFFDKHSIVGQWEDGRKIEALQRERDHYIKKADDDRNRIYELKTNKENLEKFAREEYLMKKPNEDIFVAIEE